MIEYLETNIIKLATQKLFALTCRYDVNVDCQTLDDLYIFKKEWEELYT